MQKNKLRDKAVKAINETVFYPNKGKERLLSMIEGRPDWCVSRQRVWASHGLYSLIKKQKSH